MFTRLIISIILLSFFAACNKTISKEEQKAINEELASRKIRRITDAQIYDAAMKMGDSIASTSQKKLGMTLMHEVKNNGLAKALEYCNINAYPLVDSLSEYFDADIKRASLRSRNPNDQPNEMEKQLLDAYQYNLEQGLELTAGVQKIDESSYLYTKPILLNNGLCLQCHGNVGVDVSEEFADQIKELYPNDNALGHEINDLRGMWSIILKKKTLVLSIAD
jgi:hypothetical protein